jgi:hypothetical protein
MTCFDLKERMCSGLMGAQREKGEGERAEGERRGRRETGEGEWVSYLGHPITLRCISNNLSPLSEPVPLLSIDDQPQRSGPRLLVCTVDEELLSLDDTWLALCQDQTDLLLSLRVNELSGGSSAILSWNNDKVISSREIFPATA